MKRWGFSLIELLVSLAIIAILAGVSYPSYVDSIKKSHRADAQAALMDFAVAMVRYQSQNLKYTGATPATVFATQAPIHSNKKTYNLTIEAPLTASSYILRATPISGGPQDSDGYLELLSSGERRWDKNNNGTIELSEKTW